MKESLCLIFLNLSLILTVFGQGYDSLKNFCGQDYLKYKGQEFLLKPLSEFSADGYNFLKNYKESYIKKSNIYLCGVHHSKYHELENRYVFIEDIIDYQNNIYFQMRLKDNNELFYYKYSPVFQEMFPFLVVGFQEKQKSLYVGKDILIELKMVKDINTDKIIQLENGQYYKCVDVVLDKKRNEVIMMLKYNENQFFFIYLTGQPDNYYTKNDFKKSGAGSTSVFLKYKRQKSGYKEKYTSHQNYKNPSQYNSNNSDGCASSQCLGRTQKGNRCKNRTKNCSSYCHYHD